MELFRIYYLPQLLIDLYQPHLCLCTDDEPAVFQSDSHDDTAVQPPVSGIILRTQPNVSILNRRFPSAELPL